MLAVFAAVSVFVLALDVGRVVFDGAVWTGTDGVYIVDQMQYLAWIKDASHHFLVSNLFVLRGHAGRLLPAGGGHLGRADARSGMAPWLSLLLWKPVAVIAFFFAVRALRPAQPDRRVASAARCSCSRCSSARSRSSTATGACSATCSRASCPGATRSD